MDRPHIPVISLTEIAHRIKNQTSRPRLPITGSIEITERCNLHCVHCYINLPVGDRRAQEREFSYHELCGILNQIEAEGCLWLLFTGGEPLIRPDFLDIYTFAKKKGFLITLFTNGTTVTPPIADHLARWRPFSIEITLYGRTKKTYEEVTGVPGSYERCMRGIQLLLERKLPLKLKTVVLTLNKHEVRDIKKYAGGLGLQFRFDPVLNLRIDGNRRPAGFRIKPEEVVALDMADEKRMREWGRFCEKFCGSPEEPDNLYQCGAGVNTFHINPYGLLTSCILARSPAYDLRRGTFNRGWHDFMPCVRSQKWQLETPCKKCKLMALCGQCPGWAQTEHGDQERPVDYLCRIAHQRAEAFGLNR
jgi:radical SAM protein with 4Fe4S-binding SPASM domain